MATPRGDLLRRSTGIATGAADAALPCAAGAEGRAAATRRGTFSRSAPVFAAATIGGGLAEGSVALLAGKVASAVGAPGHPETGSGATAAAIGLNVRASGDAGSLRIVSILTTSAAGNPPTSIPSTATSLCDAPCQRCRKQQVAARSAERNALASRGDASGSQRVRVLQAQGTIQLNKLN